MGELEKIQQNNKELRNRVEAFELMSFIGVVVPQGSGAIVGFSGGGVLLGNSVNRASFC